MLHSVALRGFERITHNGNGGQDTLDAFGSADLFTDEVYVKSLEVIIMHSSPRRTNASLMSGNPAMAMTQVEPSEHLIPDEEEPA